MFFNGHISHYNDNLMILIKSLAAIGFGTRRFQKAQMGSNESWTFYLNCFGLHFFGFVNDLMILIESLAAIGFGTRRFQKTQMITNESRTLS